MTLFRYSGRRLLDPDIKRDSSPAPKEDPVAVLARLFRALVEADKNLADAKAKAADHLQLVSLAETERQRVIDAVAAVYTEGTR